MSASRAQKAKAEQRQMQITSLFNNIVDQENLENITEDFEELLNESINVVDEVLENLDAARNNPEHSDDQQKEIARLKAQAEEVKESLEKSREEVEDALLEKAQTEANVEPRKHRLDELTDQDYEDLFGPMIR